MSLKGTFAIANGQEFRVEVKRKVTNSNGGVVPGATATIKSIETNVQATGTVTETTKPLCR